MFSSYNQRDMQHAASATKVASPAQAAKASVDRVSQLIDRAFEPVRNKAN
jgi:hypothetical protein